MAAQEFGLSHFTGIAVVGFILLAIALLIITFMQFGFTQQQGMTGAPANMQRSDGKVECSLINRGNVLFIHDVGPDGEECDIILNLEPNFKDRRGKRQTIKNNTDHSIITLVPINGLIYEGGFVDNPKIVEPGAYAILVTRKDSSIIRLQ